MIFLSVVIPLYNKAPHIGRALKSVLAQTIPADEVIVVDDGSTDGGGEVVKSFTDRRIKLICQENQGESAARNRGISEAEGGLIAFLDADDTWKPRFLETILHLQKRFPQAGAYATAIEIVDSNNLLHRHQLNILPPGIIEGVIDNYFKVALKWPLSASSVAIPKKILQEIGGFNVGESLGEDQDTWLRVALRYPIAWSNQYLACYYQNAVNRTVGFKLWDKEPVISITARKAIESRLISENNIHYLREYAAHFQVWAAFHCLMRGKKEVALKLLNYSRGTNRFARNWWICRTLAPLPRFITIFLLRAYGIYKYKQK
jgi:glycosyltransferase involved in cell wall biosynthesis